ncbi:MAG: AbrB/MazE/SpoVT family DNA-binding domain-containing protein [Candidatus Woesearchaeota archaeon]
MKKYPKIVQCDKRGQIVIPKDIRQELGVEEGSGFYMYSVTDEGILLKKIAEDTLDNSNIINEITEKAEKINVNPKNVAQTVSAYKKTTEGNLDLI